MANRTPQTAQEIYTEYDAGLTYNSSIKLNDKVNVNERFYAGDHWGKISASDVPTPVFNFVRKIVDFQISTIKARNTKINYSAMHFGATNEEIEKIHSLSQTLTKYVQALWERLQIDSKNLEGLKDCAISGNLITHTFWDSGITSYSPSGERIEGDINTELIDNVNLFPMDVNELDIQKQPSIIISFRKPLDSVKEEARKNGINEKDIESIAEDDTKDKQAGDMAQEENEGLKKVTVLIKYFRNEETGTIWAVKTTENVIIKPEWDTGLKLYPIANMCWRTRKNCFYGVPEITEVVPNQVAYNKLVSLQLLATMQFVAPKVLYNQSKIDGWSNKVGGAIPVSGNPNEVATYMSPPAISTDTYRIQDSIKANTQDCMGANDIVLGDVRPENTSAFVMMKETAMTPLENIQSRFYQYIEDYGRIILDFIRTYYKTPRIAILNERETEEYVTLDPKLYEDLPIRLKIDVGAGSQWTEISGIQTLDNLLLQGKITTSQYLERIPDGYIPEKDKLIAEIKALEQTGQARTPNMTEETMLPTGSMTEQDVMEENIANENLDVETPQEIEEEVNETYN